MSELASTHLALAVPLSIERLRARGGPTETDVAWAQECMQTIRDGAGGHAIAFLDVGQTEREMNLLTEVLAILSYIPGGVRLPLLGLHFDAEQPTMRLVLDDALLQELEPFRAAMDRDAALSRKLEDVSEQELARLRELEGELVRAADRGDSVQVALIEAQMDAILLVPVQVVQRVEMVGEVAQQALWDEIGA